MIDRRRFLKSSAVVALTPTIPTFLTRTVQAAEAEKEKRILVVVQLDGGNDGINTVVPFKDDRYAENRHALRLKTADLIKLDGEVGLHPRMRGMGELFEDGRLGIVQGVGYPNPNRSHFRSMAIWHTADTNVERQHGSGWIGQSLSTKSLTTQSIVTQSTATQSHGLGPNTVFVGDTELPVALRGRRCISATISQMEDLELKLAGLQNDKPPLGEDLSGFLQRSVSQAYATAESLSRMDSQADSADAGYPSSKLGNRLKLVSNMIKSGAAARVYYTSQTGYDTHASQLNTHANLLAAFSDALKAFLDDMKNSGMDEQVLVLAFSEFGRRVSENGSAGTDHGTAGPVFLAGANVSGGLHGEMPSLTDLDAGDLEFTTDFRNVYVTLIDQWLSVTRPAFLRHRESLPLLL